MVQTYHICYFDVQFSTWLNKVLSGIRIAQHLAIQKRCLVRIEMGKKNGIRIFDAPKTNLTDLFLIFRILIVIRISFPHFI